MQEHQLRPRNFRILRYVLRWLLGIFLVVLLLVIIIAGVVQIPAIQTYITGRIADSFAERTGSQMSIGRVRIGLPSTVAIDQVYVEDNQGDSLLYAGRIRIDVNIPGLLRNRIRVNSIQLDQVYANVIRLEPDTVFNYQFLLDSLAGNATDEPPPAASGPQNGNGMDIRLNQIDFNDIRIRFADHLGGIDVSVALGEFSTRVTHFDLDEMIFHLDQALLRDTRVDLHLAGDQPEEEPGETDLPDVMFNLFTLENFSFNMSSADGSGMQLQIPELELRPNRLELANNLIHLDHIRLQGLTLQMESAAGEEPPTAMVTGNDQPFEFRWAEVFEWDIRVDSLFIDIPQLSMVTSGSRPQANGFDPQNIRLQELEVRASGLVANSDALLIELHGFSLGMAPDFQIRDLSASIALEENLRIDNLVFISQDSRIRLSIFSDMDPLNFTQADLEQAHFDIHLREGQLGPDLAYFNAELNEYIGLLPPGQGLQLQTHIHGRMDMLTLEHFRLEMPGLIHASLHGQIQGLPDQENLLLDLPDIGLWFNPRQLMALLPDTLQPQGLVLPDSMSLGGFVSGGAQSLQTQLELNSPLGDIILQGEYHESTQPAQWLLSVEVLDVDPGVILDQPRTFGPVNAQLFAKGQGLEPETASAEFGLVLRQAEFNNYQYSGLEIRGRLEEGILAAVVDYHDENLSLTASQQASIAAENPRLQLQWTIGQANLQALNFMEDFIMVRGEVTGDMTLILDDFATGHLSLENIQVLHEDEAYTLEHITVETSLEQDIFRVNLLSPIMQANYNGNISPAAIPDVLARHLDRYLALPTELSHGSEPPRDKQFEVKLTVPPSDWISEFLMPDLAFAEPLQLGAFFNSETMVLSLESSMREVSFGNIDISGITLTASTDPREGNFRVFLGNLGMGNLELTNLTLEGTFDSIIEFHLAFDDQFLEPWLSLPGTLTPLDQAWELSLDQSLLINRQPWRASPDNFIIFSDQQLFAHNFRLESQQRYLLIQSLSQDVEDESPSDFPNRVLPLNITFNDFLLQEFSILEEEPLLGGLFNGFITIQDIFSDIAFTADLTVDDFSFRGDTLGNIMVMATNPRAGLFEVDASVSGQGNQIRAMGSYLTGDQARIDLELAIDEMSLASFEGLAAGAVENLEGSVTGIVSLQGEPANPLINGKLDFVQVGFGLDLTDASYSIERETITFDRNNIRFDSFTLRDQMQGQIALDGTINIVDFDDIRFNLNLTGRNFLMMDVAPAREELFSGRLLVDTDLRLGGDLTGPVVEGKVGLREGSRFSFTIPQTPPDAVGAEGVVLFIAPADTLFGRRTAADQQAELVAPAFQNLDLSLNIEVDPKTELRIVIDEAAGDNLEVTGGGVLSFGMDPGGRMSLSGRYEISDGNYLLTFYDAIRRNFRIQSGSNIQWWGDLMNALVDITAIYSIRTSARELLISQMEAGATEAGALRQQFPFDVSLIMSGELEEPDISFAISLPAEHQDALQGRVQARLTELNQTESELNKQVFALLVLGNFIHENPFETIGAGPGLSSTARSSASRILSQQLNRLSQRYVRGVNVRFDIESYEDYATGEPEGRTELQMEVSRDFLDERLRVTVGGNIELEDETRRESNPGEIAGDFLLEYLLNPEGNLVLKAFRTKQYGDIFDSQVFETGVSLLFTRSYNTFRELFTPRRSPQPTPESTSTDETKLPANQTPEQ